MAVSPSTRRARVLIAEERAPLSERLSGIVERAGFQPVVAYTGQVALSQVRALRPEVILLSDQIGPPGASETARRVKEDPATGEIPIIMLSTAPEGRASRTSYPVEACLPAQTDEESLANLIRLLAGGTLRRPRVLEETVGPLEGNLKGSPLSGILHFLFLSGKAGRVTVSDDERSGAVYFDSGSVTHAQLEEARGKDAFFETCFMRRGHFKFEPGVAAPESTMNVSGVELLLEAARQWDVYRQRLDSGEHPIAEDPTPRPRDANGNEKEPSAHLTLGVGPQPPTQGESARRSQAPAEPEAEIPPEVSSPSPLALALRRMLKRTLVGVAFASALFGAFMMGRFFPIRDVTVSSERIARVLPWEEYRIPVSLTSTPVGARVLVDGHEVGRTPVVDLPLRRGRYLIRLEEEGYQTVQGEVPVGVDMASRKLTYTLEPEAPNELGTLVLKVVPAGAFVFVNGEKLMPSPRPLQLLPGEYEVEARHPGFEPWTGIVDLKPAETQELSVSLKRSSKNALSTTAPTAVPQEDSVAEPPESLEPPEKVSGRYPEYPESLLREGKKQAGTVMLDIEVDEEGRVASTTVIESAGRALDEAVLFAVREWKYRPAQKDGKPVRARVRYRHTFRQTT